MGEDLTELVRQLEARARNVQSFVAEYRIEYHAGPMPFEVEGRMYFMRPDRSRSEARVNGKTIVSIRNGSRVRRYTPGGHEVWEYDLKEIPLSVPLNAGVDDLSSPFAAIDQETLQYEGLEEAQERRRHVFIGRMRRIESEGLMDTRKGFSLRYQQKGPEVRMRMCLDPETGMVLEMVGSDKSGSPSFEKSFNLLEVNGAMDESMFSMEEPGPGYKVVQISNLMIHAMNPDYADQPPSLN